MATTKIAIRELKPPKKASEGKDIQWVVDSFVLSSKKDADRTAYKIFRAVVESTLEDEPMTSTELSKVAGVTRGATLFHLQKFSQSGLVRSEGRKYILRAPSLEETVDSMMRDMERMFSRMRKIASEIDKELGYEGRW